MRQKNKFDSFRQDIHANVSLMMAVGFGVLGVLVGAAIDTARLTSHDQKLQDALDAATLYVVTLDMETEEEFNTNAHRLLEERLSNLKLQNLETSFEVLNGQVEGTASAELNLFFRGFLGKDSSGVAANTIVKIPTDTPCVVALNPTQTGSLLLNSGANIQTSDCEVHVHSNSPSAAIINSATNLEASRTCIAGGVLVNVAGVPGNIETNCSPSPDPFEGVFPEPDSTVCDFWDTIYESSTTQLTPGVYCGDHTFQGVSFDVEMAPGLYVIKEGAWISDGGRWDGQGVTFYFADESTLQFNSNVEVDLRAPTTGRYANALMTEAPGLTESAMVLNDSLGYDFNGVIHLPSRDITLNSGANVNSENLSIIADTIIVNNVNLTSGGDANAVSTVYIAQ